jgi:hypothetical protein
MRGKAAGPIARIYGCTFLALSHPEMIGREDRLAPYKTASIWKWEANLRLTHAAIFSAFSRSGPTLDCHEIKKCGWCGHYPNDRLRRYLAVDRRISERPDTAACRSFGACSVSCSRCRNADLQLFGLSLSALSSASGSQPA